MYRESLRKNVDTSSRTSIIMDQELVGIGDHHISAKIREFRSVERFQAPNHRLQYTSSSLTRLCSLPSVGVGPSDVSPSVAPPRSPVIAG